MKDKFSMQECQEWMKQLQSAPTDQEIEDMINHHKKNGIITNRRIAKTACKAQKQIDMDICSMIMASLMAEGNIK